jgi:hypothetical protein
MDQRNAWSSHYWQTRAIENGVYKGVVHHHCSRCSRDFVDDSSTEERYAVYVAVFRFEKLSELTTARWLGELCPGVPMVQDIAVRKRFAELDPSLRRREGQS